MLLVESFGSDAFFEQLRCAAGWNTFQNQKMPPQQPTQPQLVYSALGGRKCGRIPRTQPRIGSSYPTARENVCMPVMSRTLNPAVETRRSCTRESHQCRPICVR